MAEARLVATTTTPPPEDGVMATRPAQLTIPANEYGSSLDIPPVASPSDYGSDFSFEDLDEGRIPSEVLNKSNEQAMIERRELLPSIEFEEGETEDNEHDVDNYVQTHQPAVLRMAKGSWEGFGAQRLFESSPLREREAMEVEYDEKSRRAWSVPHENPQHASRPVASKPSRLSPSPTGSQVKRFSPSTQIVNFANNDGSSPLERFRTKPKKPLSVTDLVSPAWCELQYLYTLSRFGRKPRTQAMRTGTKIHSNLQDEVHTTVPIQVHSKEDRFGLRIWNAISGLRCLRETGLTRELEVWGVIDGQVVNGVIDELSYQCPDTAFEEQTQRGRADKSESIAPLPPGQISISEAFARTTAAEPDLRMRRNSLRLDRLVYLADVKTRSLRSVPTGASLRPTWMQLMLYRKLLETLSSNTVDAEAIFMRYDLGPLERFTDVFMQEIDGIGSDNDAADYPNLLSLWSLLVTELQNTICSTNLSPILRAEFRYAKTGDVIGSELTVYEPEVIDKYIADEMAWWKGDREAKGVEIEEAFKCRICDFAEGCEWRRSKVEEATEKSRLRRQAREKSTV